MLINDKYILCVHAHTYISIRNVTELSMEREVLDLLFLRNNKKLFDKKIKYDRVEMNSSQFKKNWNPINTRSRTRIHIHIHIKRDTNWPKRWMAARAIKTRDFIILFRFSCNIFSSSVSYSSFCHLGFGAVSLADRFLLFEKYFTINFIGWSHPSKNVYHMKWTKIETLKQPTQVTNNFPTKLENIMKMTLSFSDAFNTRNRFFDMSCRQTLITY